MIGVRDALWHPWWLLDEADDLSTEDADWERDCLARLRRGDRAAFAELYRAFAPRLCSQVLMPKLGNAEAVEDALAETFRALWEHASRLDAREHSLFAWLARVGTNKALDMHRNRARTGRALANFESLLVPLMHNSTPLHDLDAAETQSQLRGSVHAVLGSIHERYRQALELRFFRGEDRERCAVLLDVKPATFDVLLLRALRAFRRQWESHVAAQKGDER